MPPSELNPVVLRGRMVEHEGEFLRRQMWPEFVEFQNSFNYFLIKSFALGLR